MLKSWGAVLVAGSLMSVLGAAPALAKHRAHRANESGHALFVSAAQGSDANSCSWVAPCKTIGRAVGLAQAGN